MLFDTLIQLILAASLASATSLFVASYAGTITSLSLKGTEGNYSLTKLGQDSSCAPNPSWLTLDAPRGLLFCLNEGLNTVNGSLSSFTVAKNGTLNHVQNTTTISGPVSGAIFGEPAGRRAIALAHYGGSAVSTWYLNGSGKFSANQNITFTLDGKPAVPDRQSAPHEHQAIMDPTGTYVIVPDLGADKIRVFSHSRDLKLKELDPLKTNPGDGPRHAAFYNPYGVACEECTTYMLVSNELSASVTAYAVTYKPNGGGLSFERVFNTSSLGNNTSLNAFFPSGIIISPDNRYLLIGNRFDASFNVSNPDPSNSTQIPSDSISTFKLNPDGKLQFVQLAPVYGSTPRQFSTNSIGNFVAVGLQQSSKVVVLSRDIDTGLLGAPVSETDIEGQITAVVWNEVYAPVSRQGQ